MTDALAQAATRADLLSAADDERAHAYGRLTSARRVLPVALWGLLLLLLAIRNSGALRSGLDVALFAFPVLWWAVARVVPASRVLRHVVAAVASLVVTLVLSAVLQTRPEGDLRNTLVAVGAVVALLHLWSFWRWWVQTLAIESQWRRTRSILREPWARALPTGHMPAELAQVHDVRDRQNLHDALVKGPVAHALRHGYGLRVMVPFLGVVVMGIAGIAALGAGTLEERSTTFLGVGLGVVLLVPFVGVAIRATLVWPQSAFGELQRACVEGTVLLARQAALQGGSAPTLSAAGSTRSPYFVVVMLVFAGSMFYRYRDANPLSLLIALALVAVGFAGTLVALLLRSRRVRTYPLLGSGAGVLQEPSRRVGLAIEGDALVLTDVAGSAAPVQLRLDDVVTVIDLKPAFLQPQGIGIALRHDVPVVLVGGRVRHDPAIARLQDRVRA